MKRYRIAHEHLGGDTREVISAGIAVKAMLLNGLGFASAPLYLFEQFFKGKPTEQLLGAGVLPEHLNDDRLGRVLDGLYLAGITPVCLAICLAAVQRYELRCDRAHLDATSMSVSGAYLKSSGPPRVAATVPIEICHGYCRDHRPDLKQFVMNLVYWGDGDIPDFIELGDGNQADKARFAGLIEQFQQQWNFEGVYVADAALYSADNLEQLGTLRWISRVPITLTQANKVIDWHFSLYEGFRAGLLFSCWLVLGEVPVEVAYDLQSLIAVDIRCWWVAFDQYKGLCSRTTDRLFKYRIQQIAGRLGFLQGNLVVTMDPHQFRQATYPRFELIKFFSRQQFPIEHSHH